MAARKAWSGAIMFAGFPVSVVAYSLLKSKTAESFTNLCECHHEKVVAPRRCPVEGGDLSPEQMVKGVAQGRGKDTKFIALDPAAVDSLNDAERSVALEIIRLPKADTVPWVLATGRYRLVPDPDVAGGDGPVGILWNGLIASERAVVTEWSKRAGSRPSLCAIRADVYGLTAVDLPYATDLKVDAPEHAFEVNEQAQQMFEQFVGVQKINTDAFAHEAFVDSYAERRKKLVAAAIAGEPAEVVATPRDAPAVPDLMAAMSAALDSAKPMAKPAGKKSRAKAKA